MPWHLYRPPHTQTRSRLDILAGDNPAMAGEVVVGGGGGWWWWVGVEYGDIWGFRDRPSWTFEGLLTAARRLEGQSLAGTALIQEKALPVKAHFFHGYGTGYAHISPHPQGECDGLGDPAGCEDLSHCVFYLVKMTSAAHLLRSHPGNRTSAVPGVSRLPASDVE